MKQKEWESERISQIEIEAKRVLARIEDFKKRQRKGLKYDRLSREIASIKRATLDLNVEAIKLRKGYYKSLED